MLFGPRKIRIFQKYIISPAFEIISLISYLISIFAMFIIFFRRGKKLSDYKLTEIINEEFQENNFKKIKTKIEFSNYIDFLVNHLYAFDSINNNISYPYYIPYGSIRLRKYKNVECSNYYQSLNKSVKCMDEKCTIDFLTSLENNSNCGDIFKNESGSILGKFEGKYNKYHLSKEGEFIDFNIDDYYYNPNNNTNNININIKNKNNISNKEKIKEFIFEKNSDIKFLAILFNVFFPVDKVYGNVICGIEMINYRNDIENPYNIFSVSIFGSMEKINTLFIFFQVIFFIISILNLLKTILEIHSLFICSIHIVSLFSEIMDLILNIMILLYYNSLSEVPLIDLKSDNYLKDINLYSDTFIDFNPILAMKGYTNIIFGIILLTIPFKIISLFSWYTTMAKPFVQFLGVVSRLAGLFIVHAIFFFGMNYTFIEMNHNFYKSEKNYLQSLYSSMISHFFLDIINLIKEDEYKNEGNKINHIFSLNNYLIFNCVEKFFIVYFIIMIISSFVNSFEKASLYELDSEEDEILLKIKDIEEKLENEEENTDNNLCKLKKQILWLNLGNKNDIYNNYSNKNKKMILFSKANQVISFLKYLFAIKPEMQFKNLRNKIGIVIQEKGSSNSLLKEKIVNDIFLLLDWLNLVGCKIPILIYSDETIDNILKMRFSHEYIFVNFTITSSTLENFIKGNEQDEEDNGLEEEKNNVNKKYFYKNYELKITKITSFILYKISYMKKNKKKDGTKIKKSKTKLTRKNVVKYNTNCNLHNMINQIEKINNKLILKRKENENYINKKKIKGKEDAKLSLLNVNDIDESNIGSD